MKKIISKIILLLISLIIINACDDNSTDPKDDKKDKVNTFTSHSIKTNGKQYFTFSNNQGTTTPPASWDIAFGAAPLTVETSPCKFLVMPNDPLIFCGENSSIAIVNAASLDKVTSVPAESEFKTDNTEGTPFIGKNWYNAQFAIKNDVYAIKTCANKYALLKIKDYEYDPAKHQIKSIHWDYKFNSDGSMDFSNTSIDSFKTENAYTETKYFSFSSGAVSSSDTYQLKIEGSSIWLGPKVEAKKMENKSLTEVTTISAENFNTDVQKSYVTTEWYIYNNVDHTLTPRDYVYVVKTGDNKYAAFKIKSYYDSEGNSGTFTIDWKYLSK